MNTEFKKTLEEVYNFKLTNPSETEEIDFLKKKFSEKYLYTTTLPKMERFGSKSEDILNITNAFISNEQTSDGNFRLVLEGHMFHIASNIKTNKVMFINYDTFHEMRYYLPNDYIKESPNDGLFETSLFSTNEKFNEIMNKVVVKIKEENDGI